MIYVLCIVCVIIQLVSQLPFIIIAILKGIPDRPVSSLMQKQTNTLRKLSVVQRDLKMNINAAEIILQFLDFWN